MIHSHPGQASAYGNTYEWPFELFISGSQRESFRGCSRCALTYRLEASTINDTPQDDFQIFTPICIIRCPPVSCYELMDPVYAQGKWSGSVEYHVSLRHQAIALGGLVPVEARLAILEPGVVVTATRFYLSENHTIHDESDTQRLTFDGVRIVTDWPLILDNTSSTKYAWQQCLQLPRYVRKCSHSFKVGGIMTSHTLHFAATIRGGDGAESEVCCSQPCPKGFIQLLTPLI